MNWVSLFFFFFFNLPAFCLVLFNSLRGHVLSLSLSKHAGWIYLQHEMLLLETFSMFSCVLLTVDHQERAVEKRPVLDELNFVLPSALSTNNWTRREIFKVHTLVPRTKRRIEKKNDNKLFIWFIWGFLYIFLYLFIGVCTETVITWFFVCVCVRVCMG